MDKKNRVEIQDFKEWTAGVYLIEAGCGQGKNYFVFNTLFPYLHQMILRKQDGVPEAPAQAKAIVRHRKILHQPQRRTLTLSPMETVKITTDTISLTRL